MEGYKKLNGLYVPMDSNETYKERIKMERIGAYRERREGFILNVVLAFMFFGTMAVVGFVMGYMDIVVIMIFCFIVLVYLLWTDILC